MVATWDSFDVKNYLASANILTFSELYLTMKGKILTGENSKHLTTTLKKINTLIALLHKKEMKNDLLIASYFSKTIVLLEKVIPSLKDDKKKTIEQIFRDLT